MPDEIRLDNLSPKDYSSNPRRQDRYIGQLSAVRYFDAEDKIDALKLKGIVETPGALKWLVGPKMTDKIYIDWMNEQGQVKNRRHHLFAVSGSEKLKAENVGEVQGYVYFYCGPDEKKQAQLLVKEGLMQSEDLQNKRVIEISYAKSPDAPPGRMVGGIMQSCLKISEIMQRQNDSDPKNILILGYVDPENSLGERAMLESGFKKIGVVGEYDGDNKPNNAFVLDWDRLHQNIQSQTWKSIQQKSAVSV